jgi:ketosteroid isomerase-like protein
MNYDEWLERYRKAWIACDADEAHTLFTEDAIYREHPFEKPFTGRDAIRQYWYTVTRGQSAIELTYGAPVVTGNRVAVEWWANLLKDGKPITLAGEFLLTFEDGGRCRELREYWIATEGRITPPDGWGA